MPNTVKELRLIIKSGQIITIYDDALIDLAKGGVSTITRASHVEPSAGVQRGRWNADLQPVGGPVLLGFETRQEALDAERVWLNENVVK